MANGKFRPVPILTPEAQSRFWAKVDKSGGLDACWPWTASFSKGGYGWFSAGPAGQFNANRLAWAIFNGDPGTLLVCHRCNNPICVNPAHLYLDDIKGNARYMVECGRSTTGDKNGARLHPERLKRGAEHPLVIDPSKAARGVANGNARLNEAKVRSIRLGLASGHSLSSLAREHSVSKKTIVNIKLGRIWLHVA